MGKHLTLGSLSSLLRSLGRYRNQRLMLFLILICTLTGRFPRLTLRGSAACVRVLSEFNISNHSLVYKSPI
jgi:hypothetical protein